MRNRWFHTPVFHSASHPEKKVNWLELFFDLIFAAAIIQLGNTLSDEVTSTQRILEPLAKFAGLFVPLWVSWAGFTFYSNRFSIDDFLHRVLTFGLMFGVGVAAIWSPSVAGGHNPVPFALANSLSCFLVAAMYGRTYWQKSTHGDVALTRAFSSYWGRMFFISATLWLVSTLIPSPYHLFAWGAAICSPLLAPVSKAARALAERHPFDMEHLSERFGLLTIIVLGESFVKMLTGVSSSDGAQWDSIFKGTLNLVITCVCGGSTLTTWQAPEFGNNLAPGSPGSTDICLWRWRSPRSEWHLKRRSLWILTSLHPWRRAGF